MITEFVFFAADHPYFHQFMLQEGTASSERLEWLVDRHITPLKRSACEMFERLEADGVSLPAPPNDLLYMIIGAASTRYALAPEFRLIADEDPFDKETIEAHAESVVRIFFPQIVINASVDRKGTPV